MRKKKRNAYYYFDGSGRFFCLVFGRYQLWNTSGITIQIKMTLNHHHYHQFGSGLYASAFGFVIW